MGCLKNEMTFEDRGRLAHLFRVERARGTSRHDLHGEVLLGNDLSRDDIILVGWYVVNADGPIDSDWIADLIGTRYERIAEILNHEGIVDLDPV